jgi:hypothetical protein
MELIEYIKYYFIFIKFFKFIIIFDALIYNIDSIYSIITAGFTIGVSTNIVSWKNRLLPYSRGKEDD